MTVLALLGAVVISLWLLTRCHRGQPSEWIAAGLTTVGILILQYFIVSAGWLRSPLKWLVDLVPTGDSKFEESFFDGDVFPVWLANVVLLAAAAALWVIWHMFNRGRADDAKLPACLRGKPLKQFYLCMLVIIFGAMLFASHVVIYLQAEGYALAEPFSRTLKNVFWSAPLLCCAILYGAASPATIAAETAVPAPAEKEGRLRPSIGKLLDYLSANY
jgi:hypothetical protein